MYFTNFTFSGASEEAGSSDSVIDVKEETTNEENEQNSLQGLAQGLDPLGSNIKIITLENGQMFVTTTDNGNNYYPVHCFC